MDAPGILDHLQTISKVETSCTLVSIGGEKIEVEFIFLCISSLFLGSSTPIGRRQPLLGVPALSGVVSIVLQLFQLVDLLPGW